MEKTFTPATQSINGTIHIPGDKSISHRAVMLGSLAKGKTIIENFLSGEDCLQTIENFQSFGVHIARSGNRVIIDSQGMHAFKEPLEPLYFGNSGTTARLMLGILSGLPFHTVVYGDPYLTVRPMDRVIEPLRQMGAMINGRKSGNLLPLAIKGSHLKGITYTTPVKSAQVKSALLLAGLFAHGKTVITEQTKTRDHTENMLRAFGAHIHVEGNTVTVREQQTDLEPGEVMVPGDISSAAFFLVAAAIVPGSELTLKNVGLNETRTGIVDVLKQMGADLTIFNAREISGEKLGDITIKYTPLTGMTISGELIPRLIDEIPVIALLATQADGHTTIQDALELRVKETDRIKAVVDTLTTLGAKIEEYEDGMVIHGNTPLHGGAIKSYSDHRMAMMGIVASLIASEPVTLDDVRSVAISYPDFFDDLASVTVQA